jgi:hypothetical protein
VLLKQSTARNLSVFMTDSADHITGKTGLTLTITASKDGAAFASITPTVTERGTGWYSLALTTSHTDTLGDLAFHITSAGADPTDLVRQVVVDLPGATVSSVTGAVGSVTGNVGGNVTGSVGSVTARVTANTDQLAGQTVTAAAGVTFPTSVASPTNITAGTITTVTNLTNAPTAGDFTATMKTSIGTAVAASAVASVTGNVGGNVTGSIGSLAAQAKADVNVEVDTALVDVRLDELLAADSDIDGAAPPTVGSVFHELMTKTTGSFTYDQTTDSLEALRDRGDAAWTTATGFSTLDAAGVRTAVGLASANLDTQLTAIDDAVDTEVAAIKTVTDKLDTAVELDGAVYRFTANALELAPTGGAAPTAAQIADAVWEEAIADHSGTTGSTAEALNAAGAAGDPWTTVLPGAYGAGSAGKIIGDNINATISSRATQTSVDDLPTNAELATALGTADDATLAAIAALNNLSQADVRTAVGLATANLDTQLDALPTAAENATAVWGAGTRLLTAGTNIVLAKGTGITGFNDLSAAQVNAEADTALADAGVTTTVTGRIDAAISTRASQTSVDTVDDFVDTEVAAIKGVTDKLNTALELDGAVYRFTTNALEQSPSGTLTVQAIVDGVLDEATSAHQTAGTVGKAITDAQSAGDPWASQLETGVTASTMLRAAAAVAAGKTSITELGAGAATVVFRDISDASDLITATMADSERTAVTVAP